MEQTELEKKAEEYANTEINKMFVDESEEVYVRASTLKQIIKNSHLKGLAEGRKEKWHDLRKNPNDLPKECENVLLCLCGIGTRHYSVGHLIKTDNNLSWWLNIGSKKLYNIIAWCELPKFEE